MTKTAANSKKKVSKSDFSSHQFDTSKYVKVNSSIRRDANTGNYTAAANNSNMIRKLR
jgi:hypothetical protein